MHNKKPIGAIVNIRFKGCEEIEEQTFAFGAYDEETDTNTSEMHDDEQGIKEINDNLEDFDVIDYELIFGSSNENEK